MSTQDRQGKAHPPGPLRRRGFNRWSHRWASLVVGPALLLWAASGMVLNHRAAVSGIDVDRNRLSRTYRYKNWNQAAVRGGLARDDRAVLLYGNIGIWETDAGFRQFVPFMDGLPVGTDNRRVFKLLAAPSGRLYAGTQTGLYRYDDAGRAWRSVPLDLRDRRIVDLTVVDGRMAALSRDEIFLIDDASDPVSVARVALQPAVDDDGRASLFRTMWMLHSGKLYGPAGVRLVDAMAIALIFLCLTGYAYFFIPRWIRRRVRRRQGGGSWPRVGRFATRWHRRIGIALALFLLAIVGTGMFLRPPLLISIAGRRVPRAPGSVLAGKNTWMDRLRAIHWDEEGRYWIVATDDGLYRVSRGLDDRPARFSSHPPVSVMGINVFESLGHGVYLVGSFAGLFVWHPESGFIRDHMTGAPPEPGAGAGRPIGRHMVAGLVRLPGRHLVFDYARGLIGADIPMPEDLRATPMPLWNLALEIHTGRILQDLIGPAYILIVPVLGMISLWILVSGVVAWFRGRAG